MLSIEPNVVFVDDKEEEVKGIIELYRSEGYGVKFFNADLVEGDEKPNQEYSDVNLIFLDLYYDTRFDVEFCTAWIEKIIKQNSFYVLVIWSKDTQHEDDIVNDLTSIKRKPFKVITIQKGVEYRDSNNELDFNKLQNTVKAELNNLKELEELSVWKKSVVSTTNVIIGHLSNDADSEILRKKIQKIIIGHGGTKLLGRSEKNKKREVLFDGLDNVLNSNTKQNIPNIEISVDNEENLYNIPERIQSEIDTRLNSWFHFTLTSDEIDPNNIQSGLICKFNNEEDRNRYGLIEDENVSIYLKHQIEAEENSEENTTIENICIVLSRPCDVAQNKFGKNIKLISGLKVNNPIRKNGERKEMKPGPKKFDSIKLYDHLCFSDLENDVSLIIDYRYIFSVPKDLFIEGYQNIKLLNKELFSEIQVEYSSYSSRLGITQII